MARVKKVFSRQDDCVTRWLEQTQEDGECRAFRRTTLQFNGDSIWSLGWGSKKYHIASIRNNSVVLISCTKRGTAADAYHKPAVVQALKKFPEYKVFSVSEDLLNATPVEILPFLIKRHADFIGYAKRAREHTDYRMKQVDHCAMKAREYADHYGLPECVLMDYDKDGLEMRMKYRAAKWAVIKAKKRAERGW